MRRFFVLLAASSLIAGIATAGIATAPTAKGASANPIASSSLVFSSGSSVLTKVQKASIKKVVATAGTSATFEVSAAAGKFPGVSEKAVTNLAKKRGQVIKAYLVTLGVTKSNVTVT